MHGKVNKVKFYNIHFYRTSTAADCITYITTVNTILSIQIIREHRSESGYHYKLKPLKEHHGIVTKAFKLEGKNKFDQNLGIKERSQHN